ncbi:MAG: glutathione S-transferase family protein [Pseudomonadota bacterium]|nr:glutathione S-transferase family protein [Pseudomonadota bacterium]MDE3038697.1 glutathione S-transferase family protein [Pseudomonadota bacterium]
MYTLYYSPGACSMAPHVLLNELNVPFQTQKTDVHHGDGQKPEFLKLNPRGQIPVLVEDDFVIREGAAIMIYLMDKHQSPLLPKSGKERAAALEWLCFGNASLHPAYGKVFFILRNITDKAAQEQAFKAALAQINKLWAEVDARLAKNKYLCGNNFTAADILLTVIANWGITWPAQATIGPNVKRLIKEVSQRPAYQKALKTEEVEYKAAA